MRPEPKPVLFVHEPTFGGMGLASTFLQEACLGAGIETSTLELTTPERSEADQGRLGLHSFWHALRLYIVLIRLLVARQASVVYIPIAQWGLPLARDLLFTTTAAAFRVPVVIHLHGSQLVERVRVPRTWRDAVIRRLLKRRRWGVLSNPLRDALLDSGAALDVHVVRNPAPFPTATPPLVPARTRTLRVGFLGLCCTEKGLDILISSIEQLRREGKIDVELTIAGPIADVRPPTLDWIRYLGKLPRQRLERDFWPNVEMVVLPARWHEGLPFSLLEALQHGRLAVATPSLGLKELVDSGALVTIDATVASCATAFETLGPALPAAIERQQTAWRQIRSTFEPERLGREWLSALLLHEPNAH